MIAIIDYDAGNIHSVENAFKFIGQDIVVTRDPNEILAADKVVLPGVGAFGDAMDKLKEYKLINTIYDVVESKKPMLAICLGLLLLFEESEESTGKAGLGIVQGEVLHIPDQVGFKIPHIGWNSLDLSNDGRLFKGMENPYVYFVHSYYAHARDEAVVTASTDYITQMHTSIEQDNIFACQFHPEKSGDVGIQILKNFVDID